ncbi:anhydro-N-acetylmuramic acid kinase [Herbaspirillum sp. Sphag1AN]|uniref:anhydro-N-acetylmuramic acid kinase n=1 Tax=unclassified Herbaspirillum TaxID=2624150 RepID=UPI001619BAF7|nr:MULTISPECIES: anhydro-N-acetylmuramic acid kinase [unclassified Herbaspirillum]MBB3213789.1 anhydro-N-acetylmuramic acid kinase [Herbaspirillum sp. Sphag1AN]MBB3246986.1 anhydro-N-acetylmuramic acid kinase [Herbaspirillum sp. Sphag64]
MAADFTSARACVFNSSSPLYIGLMSGTSLDGVDGVLATLPVDNSSMTTLATAYIPFSNTLRAELMSLQSTSDNELQREALAANQLAEHYAQCIAALLLQSEKSGSEIRAVGVHGQTIRHRPELGFTRQTNNAALLAELCGIDVIADFRSRDIAAGGQGAPLVPAFHQAIFGSAHEMRVVVNIGGISNISILPPANDPAMAGTSGFDTGPGNVLMDAWIARHQGLDFDRDGAWGASGTIDQTLLQTLCNDPYLALPPPKSTGRDLFHAAWLDQHLQAFAQLSAADVQATLTAFTAATIADAITTHAPETAALYVCGGGAYNTFLMRLLELALLQRSKAIAVESTAILGVPPHQVEALAFAWLAQRFCLRLPGNLPAVTGASGLRLLGALYPS